MSAQEDFQLPASRTGRTPGLKPAVCDTLEQPRGRTGPTPTDSKHGAIQTLEEEQTWREHKRVQALGSCRVFSTTHAIPLPAPVLSCVFPEWLRP